MSAPALFARTWGQGPPVVLLHGLGASSRYWEPLAEASSGSEAIAPDLLGFGRSPKPPHASYDVACHLEALAPLLPARPAVVVARSTGAILAAAIAAAYPRAVRALLLLGLPAFPDEATARREVGRLGLLARLTVDGNPLGRTLCMAMCRLRPLATAIAPVLMRDLPHSIAADGSLHTWASYHRTLERVVLAHRVGDDLRAAAVPVTLLHGERDTTAPVRYVRALTDEVEAEGCGPSCRWWTATITSPFAGRRRWPGRSPRSSVLRPKSRGHGAADVERRCMCSAVACSGPTDDTSVPYSPAKRVPAGLHGSP